MEAIIQSKGMSKAADGLMVRITGTKGPLREGGRRRSRLSHRSLLDN